jgi:hypothetical protein
VGIDKIQEIQITRQNEYKHFKENFYQRIKQRLIGEKEEEMQDILIEYFCQFVNTEDLAGLLQELNPGFGSSVVYLFEGKEKNITLILSILQRVFSLNEIPLNEKVGIAENSIEHFF